MVPTSTVSRPVEFSLRLIGVWPDSSCIILQRILWTILMGIAQTFQYWYVAVHIASTDLPDLLDCLSLTMSNSLLLLKLSILWLNSGVFYDTLAMMAEDARECISIDSDAEVMTSKANLSRRFSISVIGIYSISVFAYGASALVAQDDNDEDAGDRERQFFLKMEYPFDSTVSPIYELVMVTQFIQQFTAASTAGMFNALVATLILHVGGQIDIMCREISSITKQPRSFMRSLILRHQRIITLSNNIETVFSYIALMQFLSNTAIVCFLGFVIVTSLDSEKGFHVLAKLIPYYLVVNLEAFVLCCAGEYLANKSNDIGHAAYQSSWYELKSSEGRVLLLIILRSQRQLTITIGKFMDLSLESFTQVLRASASYVSVLYAMY